MAKLPGSPKSGGRAKGVANKKSQDLKALADSLKINPFEILLHFAAGNWKELGYKSATKEISIGMGRTIMVDQIEVADRISSASKASEYLFPKRKAIELTGEDGKDLFGCFTDIVKNMSTKKNE